MRLYSGSSIDFIDDTVHNRIADKLRDAYFVTYRREASPSEINSWRNSLRAVSQVFENTLDRILESKYRPSKKLLDHVGRLLEGQAEYVLLDEQLVAFDRVLAEAKNAYKDKRKAIIVIRGGPGTGKSVIALNLLSALSRTGLNTHYVTGSKAFTETLRRIVGRRASQQVKYFNSYTAAAANDVDVMICDEAHRIREHSHTRYTPRSQRSLKPQIQELFEASKVGVFFVDDNQVVRPGEIGSAKMIVKQARENDCRLFEYKLEAQFRCSGSDGFINWVNNTLEIERTANVLWNLNDKFDFRIVESPNELEKLIKERIQAGATARLTAGFCWPWSDPEPTGTLVSDVMVGEYVRPWNAKSSAGRLAREVPPENLWAYDARGSDQIGCIYTVQGFEFDYVGLIFGPDLVYRHGEGWIGDKTKSFDTVVKRSGEHFVDLVKNTYRVLLTRGIKGCFVYFMDKETEQLFRSRTETTGEPPSRKITETFENPTTNKLHQTEMRY